VEHELFVVRGVACDTLIPRGLDKAWRDLSLVERYYLRSLEAVHTGYARPTGTQSTRDRASASGPHPFAASPLRHLMFAVRETAAVDLQTEPGRHYLRDTYQRDTFGKGYWGKREGFVNLLEWLSARGNAEGMQEWAADSEAAHMLAGRQRNDHA